VSVELQLEIAKKGEINPDERDENGAISLKDTDIIDNYLSFSRDRVLNNTEYFPCKLFDGRLYVYIRLVNIEGFGMAKGANVKNGILEGRTQIKVTVHNKNHRELKIQSDKIEEKQIFKENFNFQ
jgi:hypothetical protein